MRTFTRISVALGLFAVVLAPVASFAHCEIPCGIYDDHARCNQFAELFADTLYVLLALEPSQTASLND